MKVGNPNSYPFDSYQATIEIAAFSSNVSGVPLTVFVYGAVQGFVYTPQINATVDGYNGFNDGSDVQITFNVQRNTTTRLFAAIIFLREYAR
jgi:Domain of unknown function (DUF4436)